ncbi:MAG: ABC transporter permease [Verrucomicrobia bacterium]|nr:ABC transporter permease [Verrucomicrobiota bacterium]
MNEDVKTVYYEDNSAGAGRAWWRFKRNRTAVVSGLFLLALVVWSILWPAIPGVNPNAVSDMQFGSPNFPHLFGTDVHGRDLMARIAIGTRISLLAGVTGAALSLLLGVSWGAVSGYIGGRCDGIMMRIVDILYSLPSIIFVIVLITTLEEVISSWLTDIGFFRIGDYTRLLMVVVGLGAISWPPMARIVRGEVLSLREREFTKAARALGASHLRIIFRHIIPNLMGVVVVYTALTVPAVVLGESFLSYLGLGIQPPQASLGSLIAEGAAQINPVRTYWWLIIFPGGVLVSMLFAFNFLSDGLSDVFNPRSSR